jgi:hypothetical protein
VVLLGIKKEFSVAKVSVLSIVETIAWSSLVVAGAGVAALLFTQAELRVDEQRWVRSTDALLAEPQSPSPQSAEAAQIEATPASFISWRWAAAH